MLKRLRRQFVGLVMVLVGTVLVAVLGTTYLGAYQTQQEIIEKSLAHTIRSDFDDLPVMGRQPAGDDRFGGMLGLVVEVSDEGVILEMGDAPVIINTGVLSDIVERVVVQGQESGRDRDLHIAWTSLWTDDDELRIALVDTSQSDVTLHDQAVRNTQLVIVALVALFGISWWLSGWALRPVERAWEQQRRFVADASHELKTPLAVILANTQILQRDETLSPDTRRWVDSTAEEVEQMRSLVSDLLQLARADEKAAGVAAGAMRSVEVDLSELVESAALEFDAIAFERGCLLEEEVAEGILVTGDPEWLERLVRILIDNACKYGASGTTVSVSLVRAGAKAQLTVHNDGNAIDPEDLPHVFERFYRSDKARTHEGEGGFGLGLAIAKGIVDAHGGKISVTSSAEEGTTFSVLLP